MARVGGTSMRLRGFLRKEVIQIRRDPSSILLAIVMPVVLLLLFGYGVSLDPRDVPLALVLEERGDAPRDLAARFDGSPYFDARRSGSMAAAERALRAGRVDGIVRVRDDIAERLAAGRRAPVQLIVSGVDANRARLIEGYVRGAVGGWLDVRRARGERPAAAGAVLADRIWFNPTSESRHFLVPGLLTLIMTLIGTLLTALVIAREWERGTMEAILATPLSAGELLLGKLVPYFGLGMAGMGLSVLLGVLLFGVPLRGSIGALVALSAVFLLAALGLGLAISATLRVQFAAAQTAVVAGFLPAFFLSGLLFDLESAPQAIQTISLLIPARYFVTISHTLFLAGDVWAVLAPAGGVLAAMAVLLLTAARLRIGRRLPQ